MQMELLKLENKIKDTIGTLFSNTFNKCVLPGYYPVKLKVAIVKVKVHHKNWSKKYNG